MPLPKQRHSKARGRRRRTHWKLTKSNLVPCPKCKEPKLPHRICGACGFYNGKQAVEIKAKEKKEKRR